MPKRFNLSLGLLLSSVPLVHYAFTLLFYVCASASLGEWANTMGAHDPKGFFGGVPHFISITLMMASFAVAPLVLLLGYKERRIAQCILVYGISLTISMAMFRQVTPWLGMWIMD